MKILTVGGAMVDTIAIIESDRIERMTMMNADSSFLLMEEGRKTEAEEISTHCGGGAVNAAVAMARLGHDVAALIKVGRDTRADTILSRLKAEGISTEFVVYDDVLPTGAAVMVASHERNATVFTFRGANTTLTEAELADSAVRADLVYIAGLSNKSADCFEPLVRQAKKAGAMVATNPGVRQLSARGGAFFACLAEIDILSINSTEAGAIVPHLIAQFGEGGPALATQPGEDAPLLAARGLTGGGFDISLVAFCKALHTLGPTTIVVTDGRDGAFVSTGDRLWHAPVPQTPDVAGTAGAGDAFGATFAATLAAGIPIEDALKSATLNALSVVQHVDTQTGLLSSAALQERVALAGDGGLRAWPL